MDFTVDERMDFATSRAREKAAEKHFFDNAQPFFPLGFSVYHRNPGHWDISARQCPGKVSAWKAAHPEGQTSAVDGESERAFRIRGEPGNVVVYDERWNPTSDTPRGGKEFRSVMSAMLWIMEELMQEPTSPAQAGKE